MKEKSSREDLANIEHLLVDAIELESKGLRQESADKYYEAHTLMLNVASHSPGDLKHKRMEQAEAILKAYQNMSGKSVPKTDSEEGSKLLAEIGLEPPEIPRITFDSVAGLQDIKNQVMAKIVYPMRYKELSEDYNVQFGGGMLLYGPPGTGKTFVVKAIANEVKANFINVNPSFLYSEWFGKFEKNISKLFRAAYLLSPSILFFDEIDAIAPRREDSKAEVVKRGVTQLLTEVGGINSQRGKNIFMIAATNNPWEIDEAILRPGRFDVKIYVPPPDREARRIIFRLNLEKIRLTETIDYGVLAERTEGYSGADIEFICRKSGETAFMEAVRTGERKFVSTGTILSTIDQIKPSIDRSIVKKYENYRGT